MRRLWNTGKWLRASIGRRLTDERFILELLHPERLEYPNAGDSIVLCYRNEAEVTEQTMKGLESFLGAKYVRQCFSQNARLYVLLVGQSELASLGWVKSGRDIPRWLVPLEPDDFVISRGYTLPRFRGQHLRSHCIAVTYAQESQAGGRCFSDCNVHNLPSIRQLTRTGFEIIARVKPPR